MKKRSTIADRRRIKHELSNLFNLWITYTDQQLMEEAKKVIPCLDGTPDRGLCLKILVMNKLDEMGD